MVASRMLASCHSSTNAAIEAVLAANARQRGEMGRGIATAGRLTTCSLTDLGGTVLLGTGLVHVYNVSSL
jgi:hypothetical protein